MTFTGLWTLLPLIVLAVMATVVMLVIAFHRQHLLAMLLTVGALALALISLPIVATSAPQQVSMLLVIDSYALFYMGLIFAASAVVAVFAYIYLEGRQGQVEELYVLLLLATIGAGALVSSTHFASFFLGLELLSVSLYGLIAYCHNCAPGIEAGVKYLVLAAASSAFLLFGMALVYADLGTMEFATIAALVAGGAAGATVLSVGGVAFILVGIGYKLAVVPFHMWTPDVYQGASAPVTAFVATISKGAMFGLLLRFFAPAEISTYGSLYVAFLIIAIASMFFGNLLALLQSNVKRILAYSSIAHLGYLLVAFLAGGALGVVAATFYLVAYFVTTLGAFGIVTVLSDSEREAESIDDYRGLFWRRPWLAATFTAMLLSLAGIPLTAGFFAKFYVATAGVGSSLWALVIALVVASTVGLYYYLRLAAVMYTRRPAEMEAAPPPAARPTYMGGAVLVFLVLLLLWFGVYPAPLIDFIRASVGGLS
ncbi:MAG: NADH-quinone oxidoreductase subunit N [Chloroflexota bacterium]